MVSPSFLRLLRAKLGDGVVELLRQRGFHSRIIVGEVHLTRQPGLEWLEQHGEYGADKTLASGGVFRRSQLS